MTPITIADTPPPPLSMQRIIIGGIETVYYNSTVALYQNKMRRTPAHTFDELKGYAPPPR